MFENVLYLLKIKFVNIDSCFVMINNADISKDTTLFVSNTLILQNKIILFFISTLPQSDEDLCGLLSASVEE